MEIDFCGGLLPKTSAEIDSHGGLGFKTFTEIDFHGGPGPNISMEIGFRGGVRGRPQRKEFSLEVSGARPFQKPDFCGYLGSNVGLRRKMSLESDFRGVPPGNLAVHTWGV